MLSISYLIERFIKQCLINTPKKINSQIKVQAGRYSGLIISIVMVDITPPPFEQNTRFLLKIITLIPAVISSCRADSTLNVSTFHIAAQRLIPSGIEPELS